ncbi:MAG: Gfo/Idh/MocA family oxidoreductase [Chloroflexi bacterium]|nr:Gfo/Idh/MocA family oxidoreductase [Chloroflexota bacterium]MBV9598881.1 Gfo/Idh/MocA family oxidoreductase [Chloroflexota bacterium]
MLSLPEIDRHPGFVLTAAADLREDALAAFEQAFGGKTYDNPEALCASPDVDLVYICTPNYLHAEHAILAAEHRKHVLVEKPMAISVDECTRMIAAAERNAVQLMTGHAHSYDPPIRLMRDLVRGGELGALVMLQTWNFTDLMYRSRAAWELDTSQGGGVVFIQGPHQVDVVRFIGGGLVRSVRARALVADPERPTEGAYTVFLEFEDGTPATLVYSGYGHFDTGEFTFWLSGTGAPRSRDQHARTQRAYLQQRESASREARRFGGTFNREAGLTERHQPFFGLTLVSCQRGDVRQSPDGVIVIDDDGQREISLPAGASGRQNMLDEVLQAIASGEPAVHDGRWGRATVEVLCALLESSRTHREVALSHQVALTD